MTSEELNIAVSYYMRRRWRRIWQREHLDGLCPNDFGGQRPSLTPPTAGGGDCQLRLPHRYEADPTLTTVVTVDPCSPMCVFLTYDKR